MSKKLSEQDLYSLFDQLSTDDMPSGMTARIENMVLAEVRSTLQPGNVSSGRGSGWFAQIFDKLQLPSLQLLPSFAMGAAAAAVIIVMLLLNPEVIERLVGIDPGPGTGSSSTLVTPTKAPTAEPTLTEVPTEASLVDDTPLPSVMPTETPISEEPAAVSTEELSPDDNSGVAQASPEPGETNPQDVLDAIPTVSPTSTEVGETIPTPSDEGAQLEKPFEGAYPAPNVSAGTETNIGPGSSSDGSTLGDTSSNDSSVQSATDGEPAINTELEPTATTEPQNLANVSAPTETSGVSESGIEESNGSNDGNEVAKTTATPTVQPTATSATVAQNPTVLPTATNTASIVSPSGTSTTSQPVAPTNVPVATAVGTIVPTATTVTSSPSPTASLTPTNTSTPKPTSIPGEGPVGGDEQPVATHTVEPTKVPTVKITTPTETDTPVPAENGAPVQPETNTPAPTETDTPAPTLTATNTSTPVPSGTPTSAPTVNHPPVAQNYSVGLSEDGEVTVDLRDEITDEDGDSVSIMIMKEPDHGTLTVQNGSVVRYQPKANFNGNDLLLIQVKDSNGLTAVGTVTFAVESVNDLPEPIGDNYQIEEDSPLTIDPAANDSDVDGDALTIVDVGNAAHGTASFIDGKVNYVPNRDFNGDDSFTYTISDGSGQVSSVVDIQVVPGQDPPSAGDDQAIVDEDSSVDIDVLANDSDVDDEPIQIVEAFDISSGTVDLINDGTALRYTPAANANGSVTFSYRITDRNVAAVGRVNVVINPLPDAPQAVDDVIATQDDVAVSISPLANDIDADGDALKLARVMTLPSNGVAEVQTGNVVFYTPNINFSGSDVFTYLVEDTTGLTSEARITVNVTSVNDPPKAEPDEGQASEDQPISLDVLANDSDPDNDTLNITKVSPTDKGIVTIAGASLNFVPNPNFTGVVELTYEISDGSNTDQSTAKFTFTSVPDAPVAQDDTVAGPEDTIINVPVLENDSDVDGDTLRITIVSQPSFGSAVIDGNTIVYTPRHNFFGGDSFNYTITDGNGATTDATATVQVTVTPVNDPPPDLPDMRIQIPEDEVSLTDVLSGTVNPDNDKLTIAILEGAKHGEAKVISDSLLQYVPNPNFNGEDTVKLLISDGGSDAQEMTVTIVVTAIPDAPLAGNDEFTIKEDAQAIELKILENDIDPDSIGNTTLTIAGVSEAPNAISVLPTADHKALTFTPAPDYSGIVTFTYRIESSLGSSSATGTVKVTIDPVNDVPVAVDDVISIDEDSDVLLNEPVDVVSNDIDVDTPVEQLIVGLPAQDVVGLSLKDNKISYRPPANYNGTVVIIYTVSDQVNPPVNGTLTVNIAPINDAPDAVDDANETTSAGQPVTILALTNDVDVEQDALTIASVMQPANGTVEIVNGTEVVYRPNPEFSGTDTFVYSVSDGVPTESPDIATVTVTVTAPPGNPPTANDDPVEVEQDKEAMIDVLLNDLDPDGDELSIVEISQPANGSAELRPNEQSITYRSNPEFIGVDTFTYKIQDEGGLTAQAAVIVTVVENIIQASGNDQVPVADLVTITSTGEPVTLEITGSQANLTFVGVESPAEGGIAAIVDSAIVITPTQGYSGTFSLGYSISNGVATSSSTITVTVSPTSTAP